MGQAGSQPGGTGEQLIEVAGLGLGAASERFVQVAMAYGYTVVASGPNRFRIARTYRPKWALFAAVGTALFVGLGLLFLLVKRTETGDVVVAEDRAGVKVRITGALQQPVIDALRQALGAAAPIGAPRAVNPVSFQGPAPAPVGPPVSAPVVAAAAIVSSVAPSFMPASVVSAPDNYAPVHATVPRSVEPVGHSIASQTVLQFADGRAIGVGVGGVLGRDPSGDPALPGGHLYPIADPSLSKTHLSFGPLPTGVWVLDHHSTNGTVVSAHGVTSSCTPGVRVEAPFGAQVVAGDVTLVVGSR